jgi:hypothetical protein
MRFRDHTKHFSFSSSDREGSLDCGTTKHIPIQALPQYPPPTVCSVLIILCIIHNILLFHFNEICICLLFHVCLIVMQLSKESGSPENWLSVELVIRSPLLQQDMSTVLAKALLHIHTIMHDSPLLGEVELKETSGEPFAVLAAEFVFTYGMFGYGESFQLHHHVRRPGHFLHHSMFPRIQPPESRTDANWSVVSHI